MADLNTPLTLAASTDPQTDALSRSLPDSLETFECDLDELETAEDFLDYFGVTFVPAIVQVNRLHILQRFHDYLAEIDEPPDSAAARYRLYADLLRGAYQDFVGSDARTEKVFRVFKMREPRQVNVGLDQLLASRNAPTSLTEQPR
ncbi:nitrogenase-stabilizing/protective protein NifW [Halochromatium salexigens]|uniref:Nitrogenase-stabilizing/protective protein NifW n=1 Tax=Halochromatium salexigens TaxID=49447 RepID=A0AAJ0XGD8_HALSE|nr:nitrogen fixation protein NifW [Halochromatium salexigens]